jgi:ABC-type iron transport system FetAB ATPase subunit
MLQIDHLSVVNATVADLVIGPGEFVSVMGPSGSGKTLLLRAIADLDPNDGQISLNGMPRAVIPAPDWRARVCFAAAHPAWWAPRVCDHMVDQVRAAGLCETLLVPPDSLAKPVTEISTGEAQRLALIRAIDRKPQYLLLDEPTAALDKTARAAVESCLRDLKSNGTGLMVVTHDRAQAKRLGGRLITLTKSGTRQQVL